MVSGRATDRRYDGRVDRFPFVHREQVRFRDVDGAGHVNNAVFLTYIESARIAFARHLGLVRSLDELGMIVARVEMDFRSPIALGEEVDVGVRIPRLGTKSFGMDHALYAGDRLAAEATTVLVAYDYARRETMPLPERWRTALEQWTPAAEREATVAR